MKLTGSFEDGCPTITLHIESPAAASLSDDYPGIIDTGFNGFVLMSTEVSSQLGLIPSSVTRMETADGTKVDTLTAECIIIIGEREVEGTALVHPGVPQILFGNDLLRKANLRLVVDANNESYELTDECTEQS